MIFDNRPKVLAHKSTDTNQDLIEAALKWDPKQKLSETKTIMEDIEINI
jgi:hypothetical protein